MEITQGHLLGGRLRYAQPADGYRTGIEPVLLAATIPARPGQRVIEAGTGAGAGLLCLSARVPGLAGSGIEIDPAMAALARHNLQDNAVAGIDIVTADVTALSLPPADHIFANPPWHAPGATPSPRPRRRVAKQATPGLLAAWGAALCGMLRDGGSLTLILPAVQLAEARALLGRLDVLLLHPKQGRAPKLVIARSAADADGRERSVVLHSESGAYTPAIQRVLREGEALRVG